MGEFNLFNSQTSLPPPKARNLSGKFHATINQNHHMQTPTNHTTQKTKLLLTSTPYQLKGQALSSDSFYFLLDLFAEKVTTEGHKKFGSMLRRYRGSLEYLNNNFKQSLDENLLDLLMLSVLWNEHKGRWGRNIKMKEKLLSQLFQWRTSYPNHKERLDALRGKLAQKWINRNANFDIEPSLNNFRKLNLWLSATNEYNQEVFRLNSWLTFLETIPEIEAKEFFNKLASFGNWFKTEAGRTLNTFTYGVNSFLKNHQTDYVGREDYFFTGKKEVEYHLNMVGAAIMNKNMRSEFLDTEHKVLLLPSCMKKSENCQAVEIMNGTVCRHCNTDCNISKVSTEMLNQGVHTFIVNHATGFSSALKQWANQSRIGLIGTACTLNLIQGGIEMKRLNIPAQCIFLEYSGCQKHWTSEGKPTNVNLSRLKTIVEIKKNKAV